MSKFNLYSIDDLYNFFEQMGLIWSKTTIYLNEAEPKSRYKIVEPFNPHSQYARENYTQFKKGQSQSTGTLIVSNSLCIVKLKRNSTPIDFTNDWINFLIEKYGSESFINKLNQLNKKRKSDFQQKENILQSTQTKLEQTIKNLNALPMLKETIGEFDYNKRESIYKDKITELQIRSANLSKYIEMQKLRETFFTEDELHAVAIAEDKQK